MSQKSLVALSETPAYGNKKRTATLLPENLDASHKIGCRKTELKLFGSAAKWDTLPLALLRALVASLGGVQKKGAGAAPAWVRRLLCSPESAEEAREARVM